MRDVRVLEKTYQSLYQLIGRVGREKNNAKVIMQTHDPDNWFIKTLIPMDYGAFLKKEIECRKNANMPPFTKLCTITIRHRNESK